MPNAIMDIKLTNQQHKFFTSNTKFCLFSGGIGSGKTFVGAWWLINKALSEPKARGFIGTNSYKQLHNSTLAALFTELETANIPFNYNKNSGILNIENSEILCASLENYNVLRGVELGYCWLDETRDTRSEAFQMLTGRLRDRRGKKREMRLTSSPSGFNWMYDYFVGDKKTNDYEMINASSRDNPFLPDDYVDMLKESYTDKFYEQEVLGKFVNISVGQIYYAFDRIKSIGKCKINKNYPITIGMDFNINPMTAVICQIYKNTIHVIDELYLMTSNTNEMAQAIRQKYGTGHRIIPDATGKALKTSAAGASDHSILRDAGFHVETFRNPFRVDRYNCVNNLLEKQRLFVDSSCVKLIRDLEQVSYKQGSTQPDTANKELTHISDALGYISYWAFPIIRPSSRITMTER